MLSPIQTLPSFNRALDSEPFYQISHLGPVHSSSVPLVFSKTIRPEVTVAGPSIQVLTPNTSSVPDAFYGVGTFILHNLSIIFQKLKPITQKLFGVGPRDPLSPPAP